MNAHLEFESPLKSRYASSEILYLFSPQYRHSTWRQLWVALAQAQKELGLKITNKQIEELQTHINEIDFEKVHDYEKTFRHDVMAHIHAYGDLCPLARPIIHLGATSCYVTDNGDLIQQRKALDVLESKLALLIKTLSNFAQKQSKQACLSFTHYQAAQLSTVGKRTCLWIQEFLLDLQDLQHFSKNMRFLGVKGTTGTQASFLALFHGDHEKVKLLDKRVTDLMGFERLFSISGQTYTRKQDCQLLNVLAGIATSAHKFATDLRLLANLKEIEEPFESNQIGSSAMPYKRNPMRSERICALSRFVISIAQNPAYTAATQWFERTLDDSANRRIVISEAFLAVDGILNLLMNVSNGLVVYPKVMHKHVMNELPFMATENILMACVSKGGDRQKLHERLRIHSQEAGRRIKELGAENDLLNRIASDEMFNLNSSELENILNVEQFIGRSPEQVEEFLNDEVQPYLENCTIKEGVIPDITV
ncbi:MAG: adenylosuccinate lyase [Waddliaceae bacterium]|nr:adenylosuccinate lyase [Waddliaceae bacterium]